ncbi:hypothetical protein BFP97_10105 [Roseivirga sp. 4D4]|uniref:cupin domain-containing protein n=1 Tax=Roseivirga sp. 4D4 TaxID=1889784 RepID=UPI000852D0E5|nr:cupin domain-containing protein [Roseivirga sp. 4D4]OEK01845.1 hypothetical protein BFP97_10105 [Roseivirga sp. 4D4]
MKNLRYLIPITLILIAVLAPIRSLAQNDNQEPPLKPIRIDKAALSGIGLKPVQLENEPDRKFFQRRLLRGVDLSVFIVSSESWTTQMNNFPIDEVVLMLNGKAKINPEKGNEMTFQSNQFFFIPKGYTGSWEIQAGKNYHYELSIISTDRAESADPTKTLPELIDQDELSGININLNSAEQYEKVLTKGSELTVSLKAEKPTQREISTPMKEQLVNLLSGQLTITDTSGEEHVFNTGDFFLFPKGFQGSWQSRGHGLLKYLVIEKTT